MQFTVTQAVSTDIVSNLLCSAFEGGSNYWAYITTRFPPTNWEYTSDPGKHYVQDIPLNPGGVLIFEGDHRLDLEAVQKGIQILAEKYPAHFADAVNGNDDADTGDAFLQCCLFGEVIYG